MFLLRVRHYDSQPETVSEHANYEDALRRLHQQLVIAEGYHKPGKVSRKPNTNGEYCIWHNTEDRLETAFWIKESA